MRSDFGVHVRFRGRERLFGLTHVEGEWHASIIVPGELDMLTDEVVEPAPRGTKLPTAKLHNFDLRIEAPKDHVVSLEMGKLLSAPGVSVAEGWIGIRLTSVMAEYHENIGLRHLRDAAQERCTVLDFRQEAQNLRRRADREMER